MALVNMRDPGDKHGLQFQITIHGQNKMYTFQAATKEVRQMWVTEIRRLLQAQFSLMKGEEVEQSRGREREGEGERERERERLRVACSVLLLHAILHTTTNQKSLVMIACSRDSVCILHKRH